MKQQVTTIIIPLEVLSAYSVVLVPYSTQQVLSESIYLKKLRETITVCPS